jgi:hypothetical protein
METITSVNPSLFNAVEELHIRLDLSCTTPRDLMGPFLRLRKFNVCLSMKGLDILNDFRRQSQYGRYIPAPYLKTLTVRVLKECRWEWEQTRKVATTLKTLMQTRKNIGSPIGQVFVGHEFTGLESFSEDVRFLELGDEEIWPLSINN